MFWIWPSTSLQSHMVCDAARPVTFAGGVTGDRGQIRVEFGPRVGIEQIAPLSATPVRVRILAAKGKRTRSYKTSTGL